MRYPRTPWLVALTTTGFFCVAACSSSLNGDPFPDSGTEDATSEGGPDVIEEGFGFDQGRDVPLFDSADGSHDGTTDTLDEFHAPDGHDETGTEDISFEGATEDIMFEGGTEDIMFEGGTEDIFDGATEDIFFDSATEDMFFDSATEDVGSCGLPDADTAVFPKACASCLAEECCSQLTACEGDPGCQSIANCIGECLTAKGTNCAVNCYNAGDAGKSLASELLGCMNPNCNTSFESVCN
jgi:hypothetical protein